MGPIYSSMMHIIGLYHVSYLVKTHLSSRQTQADRHSVDSHQQCFLFSSLKVEEGKATELLVLPITTVSFAWKGFLETRPRHQSMCSPWHQFALSAPT